MFRLIAITVFSAACTLGEVSVQLHVSNVTNARVSPYILGVNQAPSYEQDFKLVRWGGNAQTRFNYKIDATNSGNDWYFITHAQSPPWRNVTDMIVNQNMSLWIQIPAMGWVAKTTQKSWSFSMAKYGHQQKSECSSAPPGSTWCEKDAGNGVLDNGSYVIGNDPHDASEPTTPQDGAGFAEAILNRFQGKVSPNRFIFSMDNEPQLWFSSHRDVHPHGASYDETWGIVSSYAPLIKKLCRNRCDIAGPSSWGWCGYWTSGKDKAPPANGCTTGPDRQAHKNMPFLAWYLQKAFEYEKQNGLRILDILDVHYYPAGNGVGSCAEDSTSAMNRLQAPRSLYDATYTDPSWINQKITLIPTLKGWIKEFYPETKVSVSEYEFGSDTCVTSAIAHCEVLAIFATHGVHAATRWGKPKAGSVLTDAYRIYLDYDGNGNGIFDKLATVSTVMVSTSDITQVTSYGFVQKASGLTTSKLFVMLFNKNDFETSTKLKLMGSSKFNTNGPMKVYGFDKTNRLKGFGTVNSKSSSSEFSVKMPAWSARLIVVESA